MAFWFLFLLRSTADALTCPVFQCGSLPVGQCAVATSANLLTLNTEQCDAMTECTATGLLQWYFQPVVPSPGSIYNCSLPTAATELPADWGKSLWPCSTRGTVTNTTAIRRCAMDEDCKETDNVVRAESCTCGLPSASTLGFCKPSLNSSLFDSYWVACASTGYIEGAFGLYWFLYSNYFVFYQDAVDCAGNLWEVKALKTAEIAEKGGMLAAVGMLWLA